MIGKAKTLEASAGKMAWRHQERECYGGIIAPDRLGGAQANQAIRELISIAD
jgi:hypothetical protein